LAKKRRGRPVDGIILLDKPSGISSNSSLQHVKRLLDAAKAGHTGSLDPLATGVLPLCFGEATKISQFLLDADKVYWTRIRLGVKTDSGDSQGMVLRRTDICDISHERIEAALQHFRGEIEQVPSMFSALKHQGVPLYKLARAGKEVERKTRRVNIYSIQMLAFDGTDLELEISCSKGTYIRSIADDLGELLGVGAHVTALRRLKAGPFRIEECLTLSQLEALKDAGGMSALDAELTPADDAVRDLPKVLLPASTAFFIKQGQAVITRHLPADGLVRLYDAETFIGIGEILEDGRVAPKRLVSTAL
jgi:tRNA pseudouridine55 synthase